MAKINIETADILKALSVVNNLHRHETPTKIKLEDDSLDVTYKKYGEEEEKFVTLAIPESRFETELVDATLKALAENRELLTFSVNGNDGVIYTFDNATFKIISEGDTDNSKLGRRINAVDALNYYQRQLRRLAGRNSYRSLILAERRKAQASVACAAAKSRF